MQPVDQQQWTPPTAAPVRDEPLGRTWLIVLSAVLVELVVIATMCNQALTDDVLKFGARHQDEFIGQAARASQVYAWRFTSVNGKDDLWAGQLVMIATLCVLTALLVLVVSRGAVGFGRVFLGTWTAVVAATG